MTLENQVAYQIQIGDFKIMQNVNTDVQGQYNTKTLFSGIFRMPLMQERLDVLVIGDWGKITSIGMEKGYVDVRPCLTKQIQ